MLVNHSDLYNPAFKELEKKIKLIGNFKKIKIVFGKFQEIYKINGKSNILLPYFDWLSHPIAVAIKIAGLPRKIEILNFILRHLNSTRTASSHVHPSSNQGQIPRVHSLRTFFSSSSAFAQTA